MSLTVNAILSMVGPVVSARMIFCPPIPSIGSSAIVSSRMPMPPSQCVSDRQNSMPIGNASTSRRIVAPVVVKPDAVSKYASKILGMLPDTTKGNAPARDMMSQEDPTIKNPSRMRSPLPPVASMCVPAHPPRRAMGTQHTKNAAASARSPYRSDTAAGNSIAVPTTAVTMQRTFMMGFRCSSISGFPSGADWISGCRDS